MPFASPRIMVRFFHQLVNGGIANADYHCMRPFRDRFQLVIDDKKTKIHSFNKSFYNYFFGNLLCLFKRLQRYWPALYMGSDTASMIPVYRFNDQRKTKLRDDFK